MDNYQNDVWKKNRPRPPLSVARKDAVTWSSEKSEAEDRITVNYIRHELTEYEYMWKNKKRPLDSIRREIYAAIANEYPELQAECDRQIVEREGEDLDGRLRRPGDPTTEELSRAEHDAQRKAKANQDRAIAPARAEYERVRAEEWVKYDLAVAQARANQDRAIAPARAEYGRVRAEEWKKYDIAVAKARAEHDIAVAQALAQFHSVSKEAKDRADAEPKDNFKRDIARAEAEFKRAIAPAEAEYKRAIDQAGAEYERVRAEAWAKYERVSKEAKAKQDHADAEPEAGFDDDIMWIKLTQ